MLGEEKTVSLPSCEYSVLVFQSIWNSMFTHPLVRRGHLKLCKVRPCCSPFCPMRTQTPSFLKLKSRYSHSQRSDHAITFPSAQNRAFVMTETESFLRLRKSIQNSTQWRCGIHPSIMWEQDLNPTSLRGSDIYTYVRWVLGIIHTLCWGQDIPPTYRVSSCKDVAFIPWTHEKRVSTFPLVRKGCFPVYQ